MSTRILGYMFVLSTPCVMYTIVIENKKNRENIEIKEIFT